MIGPYSISISIITRNSRDFLNKCLESIKDLADEIVIVDTNSVDDTKEVARKFSDKVYDFDWVDDFSAARNFAFEKCTGDFIIWMDSDDIATPEAKNQIRSIDLSDKEIVICNYNYSHDEYGKASCIIPRERIIKRSLNLKWEQRIHEYIPIIGHKIYHSGIGFPDHYRTHSTSERNIRLLKVAVNCDVPDPRNIYYLGKELQDAGLIEEAIPYLKRFTECSGNFWEDVFNAHYRLAQCYIHKDEGEFKRRIFLAISLEERWAEPYYLMAQFYESKQQWSKAIHWYELCLNIKRPPELLSIYRPQFSTWLPALQLCVCYNAIGNIEKSYEYNETVLKYRPKDSRALSNKDILKRALERKKIETRKDGQGKKLNLGCGGKTIPGYINVDIFSGTGIDEIFSLEEIPYKDNTIGAINSEHSLEHVGWIKADKALKEWFRVLQPGGELILKIPDLGQCCKKYLDTPLERKREKDWYKYTIYGIQKSQAGEPDEAQIHMCGWSLEEMQRKLEETGFIIDFGVNYNGWDTPSCAFRALKPRLDAPKIGWICPVDWNSAQSRIRVLHVNRWFRARGYRSDIVNYPKIINEDYDIAIVGKSFDENHFKNIRLLKQYGKTVYCDLCEQLIGFPYVNEILAICDKVICCSRKLEEFVRPINPNTFVIEDAWES